MNPSAQPRFGAIVVADGADAGGRPFALAEIDGAPAAADCMYALEPLCTGSRFLVLGCAADDVQAQLNMPGWQIILRDEWRTGPIPGARTAMQRMPLLDAFFLTVCDGGPRLSAKMLRDKGGAQSMVDAYLAARRKLGRIITPAYQGRRCWPWLIDIGFRQPFVELGEDGTLESVLESNASQVVSLPVH